MRGLDFLELLISCGEGRKMGWTKGVYSIKKPISIHNCCQMGEGGGASVKLSFK